jgi:fructosamine-3-kinase
VSSPAPHPLLDPAVTAAIERAASAHLGRPWPILGFTSLDERSSHPCGVFRGDRLSVFAKLSPVREQLAAELDGLAFLSRHAGVLTPVPVASGLADVPGGTLLLTEALSEHLPAARQRRDWRSIGQVLATVHQVRRPEFGFGQDNFFGPLRQDNRPAPAWADFYRERRIIPLLRAASGSGHLPADLAAGVARIAERIPGLCGPDPYPALLHGDAQQHNFVSTPAGAALIDACPYFGHPEIDLAQLGFFQPVPAAVLDAYREVAPIDPAFADRRELWRLATYLAVIAVEPGPYLARLAGAVRRYA